MRDMTERQFFDALRKHGMVKVLSWINDPRSTVSVGVALDKIDGHYKINRRATLAKALQNRRDNPRP